MKSKTSKIKSLLKNILLFFIASFVPKTISFFLVPLYTQCLTTDEYGTIDLITTAVQLLLPVFTLQVQDAVLRFSMDREQNPAEVFSIGLKITITGFVLILIGSAVVFLSGMVQMEWEYIVYFILSYIVGALTNIFTYFMRAIDRVALITGSSILNSVITVSCNLLFLLGFEWGWRGYLVANLVGHLFSMVFLFFAGKLYRYIITGKLNKSLFKQIVKFSLPMIVSALSWWVNNSLDKYILTFFCGVAEAGILAVAYKIPTVLSALGNIVSKGFSISVIENFDKEDSDGFLGESYALFSFCIVTGSSALMLINQPLSLFLFANDFYAAWNLVPPLIYAVMMSMVSLICQQVFVAMKRTKIVSRATLLGAGVNIVLNFILIPRYEAYGAAVATAISFTVMWIVQYIVVRRYVKMKNSTAKEVMSYILLAVQMVCANFENKLILVQAMILCVIVVLHIKECKNCAKGICSFIRRLRAGAD